ncbi:MAG: FtsX-like permease family protein [Planctomycetales bacterium]|nr:FtsX-like permease family protein [Planctomycetales bacterium]
MPYRWLQTWQIGIKSLLLHPLRSLLTVLGIFIGTASVIWLLAIAQGISAQAQQQIEDLGADNIIIRSVKPAVDTSSSFREIVPYGLTRDDFHLLSQRSVFTGIAAAIPIREVRRKFIHRDREREGRLVGCTAEYAEIMKLEVERGHFLTPAEDRLRQNHCVLAAEMAAGLFPLQDPIGQAIRIEHEYYVVVGVLRPRRATAAIGGSLEAQDFSSDVYIPLATLQERLGDEIVTSATGSFEREIVELSQVTLRTVGMEKVPETAELVQDLIGRRHPSGDIQVIVPLELLEQARTMRIMFMIFLGAIAAISLLVGGIGIMNIMLATVTERTREIGIRRALGARRADITRQFLAETIVLAIAGGATGILGGLLCQPAVDQLRSALQLALPDVMATLPEIVRQASPQIVGWSIPLAFGISVSIGILFGLYPALRAAAMDPIEALRHE